MLCMLNKSSRECREVRVKRRPISRDVLDELGGLFVRDEAPEHLGSESGPIFVARARRALLEGLDARTLYVEPGSPSESGTARASTVRFETICWFGRPSMI